jgi:hypothetical protein
MKERPFYFFLLAWFTTCSYIEVAIFAPMIYTAPYVMFLMCADPLRGQVGGSWALEIETFWAPNGTRLMARCHFTETKKLSISRDQPTPTCPRDLHALKTLRTGPYKS